MYYQEPDGALYRYNIYDVNRKTARIAEHSDNIFNYYNKPFIAYDDISRDETYLLLKNKIERMQSNLEKRLYGRSNELFLLCRQNETGQMTIDYVVEDQMKRITNNAGANVFFDRDLEYLVYNDGGGLYVWHDGAASYTGEYRDIKAVDITK